MQAGVGEEPRVSEQRGGREMAEGPLLKLGTHPVTRGEPRLCPQGPASGLLMHGVVAKVILLIGPVPSCVAGQQAPRRTGATRNQAEEPLGKPGGVQTRAPPAPPATSLTSDLGLHWPSMGRHDADGGNNV